MFDDGTDIYTAIIHVTEKLSKANAKSKDDLHHSSICIHSYVCITYRTQAKANDMENSVSGLAPAGDLSSRQRRDSSRNLEK